MHRLLQPSLEAISRKLLPANRVAPFFRLGKLRPLWLALVATSRAPMMPGSAAYGHRTPTTTLLRARGAVLTVLCLVLAWCKLVWPQSGARWLRAFPPDAEWVADRHPWRVTAIICSALPLVPVLHYLQHLTSNMQPGRAFLLRRQFRVAVALAVMCMCVTFTTMYLFTTIEENLRLRALVPADGYICPLKIHAAAPMRMCLRHEACTKATRMAPVNRTILGALSFCPESMRRQTVTMIWMTDASTFSIRNQYSLESLLRHHPCVHVQVVAPLLPHDFFLTFRQLGYNVTVQRFEAETFEPFAPAEDAPGAVWVRKLNNWRSGPHFAVHKADVLRMLILYKMGGSYMDFDHIVLRPMLHISNGVGSELCHSDNPDCLSAEQVERLDVAVQEIPIRWTEGLGQDFSDRTGFRHRAALRYTPCNGVLINWEPRHNLFRTMLRTIDQEYDPTCWGCLGPRLLGKVLLRALRDETLLAKNRGSFSLLYPAMLYPFGYESVRSHVAFSIEETEYFVSNISALGAHFFGGTSSGVPLVQKSTMGTYVMRNTLFAGSGLSPAVWLVRKAGEAWCRIPPQPKRLPYVSNVSASLPKFSFPTFPRGRRFAKMARVRKVVLLCHPDWLGIREATFKSSRALQIPVVMAADLTTDWEQRKFEAFLRYYKLQAVLVQGIPPGTLELAKRLRARRVAAVGVVYHSGVSVHNIAVEEAGLLGQALQSAYLGDIYLAFLEHDQANWAKHLITPACAIPSTFQPHGIVPRNSQRAGRRLRIGLLGAGTRLAVKNFFTQLAAACMVPGAEVHVNDLPDGPSNEWHVNFCAGSIIPRGHMPSDVFTKALGDMDINLYVSWTDAIPNVVSDSLASGVPVITSDTSPWFDTSPLLRDLLVEARSDDPSAIYQRMLRALEFVTEHREVFLSEVKSMMSSSHHEAMASWKCFIGGMVRGTGMCRAQDGKCRATRLNLAAQYERDQHAASLQASSFFDKWQSVHVKQAIYEEGT